VSADEGNRFQDFFEEERYLTLKNHLYNYLLRKQAVERALEDEPIGLVLEAGSGISPVMTRTDRIVYSELSVTALEILKRREGRGWYVASDITKLPFKPGVFSHAVSSEVLEHIPDDQEALKELGRVVKPGGGLVVTFPHRRAYFAADDVFVKHFRRYELPEMKERLKTAGFEPLRVRKVLGPLDKLAMCLAVWCFSWGQGRKKIRTGEHRPLPPLFPLLELSFKWLNRLYLIFAWMDARLIPQSLAAILLVKARKSGAPASH